MSRRAPVDALGKTRSAAAEPLMQLCLECGTSFPRFCEGQKYCSRACKERAHKHRRASLGAAPAASRSTARPSASAPQTGDKSTGCRPCERCGESLPLVVSLGSARFCSDLCRLPVATIRVRECVICDRPFVVHGRMRSKTCSPACEREERKARGRYRDYIRRASVSDITADQEREMRRRTRKCRLCGIWMTSKLNRPNSKHLDHIVPINQGGTHTHGNVRIICADCNLRRPKDGSDFIGQLTLWAQGEVPVRRQRKVASTCRSGLHPWIPANLEVNGRGKKRCRLCHQAAKQRGGRQAVLQQCACGALFAASGRTFMCPRCTESTGRSAAELHAAGLSWAEVAAQVGYQSDEGARFAAKRIGYVPVPRPYGTPGSTMPKPPKLCQCGAPIPPGSRGPNHSICDDCVAVRAWRAVEMHNAGHTLRAIADELGYSSISSVTNLMRTVVAVESRMGRRRLASAERPRELSAA